MRSARVLAAVLVGTALVTAGASEETARHILDRRKALDDTTRRWEDREQRMRMRIFDRRGGERVRELHVYERREPGDEQKTILFFLAPAEVKGTGFLAFNHKGRPADQWLYLPELKRVRQITARARTESFVGTDLSYRDLDIIQELPSWSEDDAGSRLVGEEPVDGVACHVIELLPRREDIGYRRVVVWLGREDLVLRRLELYEAGDEPRKRIRQDQVRAVGAIPVAHRIEVASPGAGSRTEIDIADVKFDQRLEPDLFSQRALERGGR